MVRFYCDVHRKKDDSGYRITYTTDGEEFRHVDYPVEIPAGRGDQIFVDVIPVVHTNAFIELLRRGVEVYYLRRLTMIKKTREKLGIRSKSAKTDIRVLMAIDSKWFRKVDEDYLVMRRMISSFRCVERTKQRLENQLRASSPAAQESLRRLVNHAEVEKEVLAELISEEAEKRYPVFKEISEELGITGDSHILAREALAELLTYVDFSKSFRSIRGYLGLYRERSNNKRYSRGVRGVLVRLTIAVIGRNRSRAIEQEEVLKRIWLMFRRETQRPADIPAQQQG
ncbi:hypothetical protein HRbin02_01354 [Candidatus Calditenuaceae archaeon HR02]|nr:hypothetical protein HRbin02_01354 [Candidatus Calditenuaceae archaeon HR02]